MTQYFDIYKYAEQSLVNNLLVVKNNMDDADFYLQPSGDKKDIGRVVKKPGSEKYIGVKVKRTDLLDAKYFYYMVMHLFDNGVFESYARGSTNLQHLNVSDVKKIFAKYLSSILYKIALEKQMTQIKDKTFKEDTRNKRRRKE